MRDAFAQRGVVYMVADWTDYDPAIGSLVQSHGRNGIPLYVLYAPGSTASVILPQILTFDTVIDAIEALQ
jgi:thiol:disulfide interchange protein DsbD